MLESRYSITKFGDVINKRFKKPLKKSLNRDGYEIVSLWDGNKKHTKSVHRLVADVYVDNPYNKPCVNHIDGNKTNNNADNLEWCTYSENEKHSYSKLGKKNAKAMTGHVGKLNAVSRPVWQYTVDNKFVKAHESCRQAGISINSNYKNIWNAASGIYKTSAGYIWRFENETI